MRMIMAMMAVLLTSVLVLLNKHHLDRGQEWGGKEKEAKEGRWKMG